MKNFNILLSKLFILLLIGITLFETKSINAQCAASFTYIDNGGGNISLINNSTGNFTSTFWDFGDGTNSYWATSHTFPYNGTYNVCLSIADTATSCFDTFCDSITITSGSLTCSTTAYSSYYGLLSYGFYANTTGVQPLTYSWDFGDGNFSSQSSPNHTYSQMGIYTVIVSVTDALGCISNDTLNINITCTGSYTYIDNGGGNYAFNSIMNNPSTTYFWDFGDGTNSTLSSPNHSYSNNGVYMVCLTVTDSTISCSNTYCDSVYVTGTGNINCTFGYGVNQNWPSNSSFTFWSNANATYYFWDFGDGTYSNQANPTHNYSSPGTYTYCLVADSCPMVCGNLNAINCQSNFYYYPDSLNIYDVIVVNTATGNNLSYLWNFGDGDTSIAQYPQHTYATTGNYYLCLTINDGNGCVDTYCDSINASGINKTGFTINVIDPNATGINEIKSSFSEITIYPNPFKDNITIHLNLNESSPIEIFVTDLLGNNIATIKNEIMSSGDHKVIWKPENITNGIYLLNIRSDQELQVKKLVLNK